MYVHYNLPIIKFTVSYMTITNPVTRSQTFHLAYTLSILYTCFMICVEWCSTFTQTHLETRQYSFNFYEP
jgi:hypothetical protein